MSKKVLIISSSYRKDGNSETLAKEFARGAADAGNQVEFIFLRDIKLEFCRGCLHCQDNRANCVIDDDVNGLLDVVSGADVLVFATPLYYGSVSGQLKTFMDRLNPLFVRDNDFAKVYFIGACAYDDESAFDCAINEVREWIDCFEGVDLAAQVLACNVTNVGDIVGSYNLKKAYIVGNSIK